MTLNALTLVDALQRRGVEFQACGDRLRFRPAWEVTPLEHETLRHHKGEILDHLQREQELRLPFPLGYGGLPEEQVVSAEGWNDAQGITDPCARRLNVYMWIMSGMTWNGLSNEFYDCIKAEYHRLRHEAFPRKECGYCDFG